MGWKPGGSGRKIQDEIAVKEITLMNSCDLTLVQPQIIKHLYSSALVLDNIVITLVHDDTRVLCTGSGTAQIERHNR